MPYPRPVSPISLETCAPPASDIDLDGVLGSDDELDDDAGAAKRQRIERLAESYLEGKPLFILSASLRGPFDKDWVNPWRKNRKVGTSTGSTKGQTAGRVVQETDLQHARRREALTVNSRLFRQTAVLPPSPSAQRRCSSSRFKSDRKTPTTALRQGERQVQLSPGKSRQVSVDEVDEPFFAVPTAPDWLKKDRQRMNFLKFDPPSSPTTKVASRKAEDKRRGPELSPSRLRTPTAMPMNIQPQNHPPDTSAHSTRSAANVSQQPSASTKDEPQDPSLRVISSSSQLPRFEYRRWHHTCSEPAQPKSPSCADADEYLHANSISKDRYTDAAAPYHIKEPPMVPALLSMDEGPKSLRFADNPDVSKGNTAQLPVSTEENSCENLPSAQEVPAPPGVSDRITSLHSTMVHKADTENGSDHSPGTQLSTQAALIHAQKSFQDDLESPDPNDQTAPGRKRPASRSPSNSPHLYHTTPFARIEASHQTELTRTSNAINKDMLPALSTQCMIDAATPYAFSTVKKLRTYRAGSPTNPASAPAPAAPPSNDLESVYQTAHSSTGGGSPRLTGQQSNRPLALRSGTQATSLPFTLSESTPATAQDGQGVHPESFNLSQAIAEAGSWLQQSFDFMRESSRQPSQAGKAPSSGDAHPSALDLDLAR
ncbi:hypothetical protein N7474_007712 [Penicillium riverlandense]|uniref:uncharacterized protein n=1 Tax=Penicillium riverlandense TaxID=1903569 RepID=UPI0025484C76|nr:uncharacterized protein N7474_007712 [Penicillium riverlandense]KAJ5811411.1 hypothetical protein N7474_007712 [Penicillium riverlandense]